MPASCDASRRRSNAASTYSGIDRTSSATNTTMRSLAVVMTSMPAAESSSSAKYSGSLEPSRAGGTRRDEQRSPGSARRRRRCRGRRRTRRRAPSSAIVTVGPSSRTSSHCHARQRAARPAMPSDGDAGADGADRRAACRSSARSSTIRIAAPASASTGAMASQSTWRGDDGVGSHLPRRGSLCPPPTRRSSPSGPTARPDPGSTRPAPGSRSGPRRARSAPSPRARCGRAPASGRGRGTG